MKVSVSLADFFCWEESVSVDAQLKYIKLIKDLDVDGVELHISETELLEKEYIKFQGNVENYYVTVHLPKINYSEEIFEKIKEMSILFNVQNFVIHAGEYLEGGKWPEDIHLILENSDIDKPGFSHLKEVGRFGKDICLDINHLEETHPGQLEEQIGYVKDMIQELHVSALENPEYDKKLKGMKHYLINGSSFKISPSLPKDVIWVIEGVIPKDRLDLLKKEIELIRNI